MPSISGTHEKIEMEMEMEIEIEMEASQGQRYKIHATSYKLPDEDAHAEPSNVLALWNSITVLGPHSVMCCHQIYIKFPFPFPA